MKAALAVGLGLAMAFTVGVRHDPRARIFVQRGCTECHAISGLGVAAAKDVGPDLTFAYADVVHRYGVNLESFLNDPSGVMRLMLASHLHLARTDRDSMLHILKGLYEERRADGDAAPLPGHRFDAVLYYDTRRAVEPLERTGLWERGEVPETFRQRCNAQALRLGGPRPGSQIRAVTSRLAASAPT